MFDVFSMVPMTGLGYAYERKDAEVEHCELCNLCQSCCRCGSETEQLSAELQVLEAEHKSRMKENTCTPEEHLERSLRISALRARLRDV